MNTTTLFSFIVLSGVFSSKVESAVVASKKRTVGILIFDNVEVLDFAGPFEVFSVSSQLFDHRFFDVKMIAKTKDPVIAVNGLSVNPHYSFNDAPELDILIIPGGRGARTIINDEETLRWVNQVLNKAELTMSVCTGAILLAKLRHLDNKSYCTHHTVYSFVQSLATNAKPEKSKRFVQSSEKLYTSAGISAGIDLSFHIVEKLHGKEVTKNTAMYMEYKGYK